MTRIKEHPSYFGCQQQLLNHTNEMLSHTKKVQVGKDQERFNQRKIPTPKTEVGKKQSNNQVLIP